MEHIMSIDFAWNFRNYLARHYGWDNILDVSLAGPADMIQLTMPATTPESPETPEVREAAPVFARAATAVLEKLRRALTALVTATPGEIRTAADFHRAMGVDARLGWQVYRIAHADNDLACGLDVPSGVSMRKLFKAALKQRVPETIVKRAAHAFEDFETLVQEHAGDREAFISMVSGLTGDEESQIDFQHRRAAFAANSHIVGVQARTRLGCLIVTPSATGSFLANIASIMGFIDLRWLRAADVPVVLSSERCNEDTKDHGGQLRRFIPLDPDAHKRFGGSLLADYCSRPLAQIETIQEFDGSINTVLRSREVGNASSRTYLVGTMSATPVGVDRQAEVGNKSGVIVRIPCQTLVHDVLIHESYVVREPTARAYSDHDGGTATFKNAPVPLLQKTTVSYLGNGADALHTRDVPRYAEMVEEVAKRVGFNLEPLRVYRCRVEYPFMPSSVVLHFEAPEKPAGAE
jgi:hypothetical protein